MVPSHSGNSGFVAAHFILEQWIPVVRVSVMAAFVDGGSKIVNANGTSKSLENDFMMSAFVFVSANVAGLVSLNFLPRSNFYKQGKASASTSFVQHPTGVG